MCLVMNSIVMMDTVKIIASNKMKTRTLNNMKILTLNMLRLLVKLLCALYLKKPVSVSSDDVVNKTDDKADICDNKAIMVSRSLIEKHIKHAQNVARLKKCSYESITHKTKG